MAAISSPHDSFFRAIFGNRQMAVDYFQSALPAHIIALLDFSTLRRVPDSYVSGELEKTMSDVIYTCRRRDGRGSVSVCLLVEHKSRPDKFTPVQVGGYLFSGYQQQINEGHKKLTPIIPVLFYHGRQKWEYWTLDRLFDDLGDELLVFLPKFEYVYHNLRDTPDAVVEALRNQFLASALLVMKHSHNKAWLARNFLRMLLMALPSASTELQQAFLVYSFLQVEMNDEQLQDVIEELPITIKRKVMSTYDLLSEKGIEKGIEQGSERGIEKGIKQGIEQGIAQGKTAVVSNLIQQLGFDDDTAAGVAEVPVEFVKKVREDLNQQK